MDLRKMKQFAGDERGANMVEYVIMMGLIAIVAIVIFQTFGQNISTAVGAQKSSFDTTVGVAPNGH